MGVVKYLIVVLILASFLPLQSRFGCGMELQGNQEESSCHQEMTHHQQDNDLHSRNKLRQSNDHSDCYFCQSGLCNGLTVVEQNQTSLTDERFSEYQCSHQNRFILPMDIFLIPIEERAPPLKNTPTPFLSYSSWQAFYSIFRI